MLKRILDKLVLCGRLMVVVIALVSLCVSGAGAAQRIFAAPETADDRDESKPLSNQLVPGHDPEAAPDGMTDFCRPWSEPVACIQAPMLLVSNHCQLKSRPQVLRSAVVSSQPLMCGTNSGLPATSCRVSWSLGRQFTLIGAKPSGTG
jgi:hypothetical protein